MTVCRLACVGTGREVNAFPAPSVRLALGGPQNAIKHGLKKGHVTPPALLVSYVYLKSFAKVEPYIAYRDWVLDSGAFSAANSGKTIHLDEYIDEVKKLQKSDPKLTEVFSLDVIGNSKATLHNTEKMWEAGIEAIPCFHVGEPVDALLEMAKTYPKIALGGAVGMKGKPKLAWASSCFSRVWPKKIHGFGFGSKEHILALPWHSVDATTWEIGPTAFGRWFSRPAGFSPRGADQDLFDEVAWYLRLEAKAQAKWRKTMQAAELI